MALRCSACNSEIIRVRINKFTGKEETLCSDCLSVARLAALDIEPTRDESDLILDFLEVSDREV